MMRTHAALSALVLCTLAAAPARAFEEYTQYWGAAYLQAPVVGKLRVYAEAQYRKFPGDDHRLLARPALYYALGGGFTAWAGYAWTPIWTNRRTDEHRPWQQLMHQHDEREVTLINRVRLEERFIDGAGGMSLRGRYMARFVHRPKRWHGFGIVVWDELFIHLNTVEKGPRAGLDQNRLGLGVQYAFSKKLIFEPTYIANAYFRPGREGRYGHTAFLAVWITF